ncbi:MAG: hypothetical protein ACJ8H8_28250, partial [Geminicoccaceae bacterium]
MRLPGAFETLRAALLAGYRPGIRSRQAAWPTLTGVSHLSGHATSGITACCCRIPAHQPTSRSMALAIAALVTGCSAMDLSD